jgi:hypothetical protein
MVVRVPTDIKARSAIEINGTSYAADARIKVQDLEFLGRTNALSALLSKGTLYPTYGTSRNLDMPNGHPGPVVLPVGVVQALLAAETTQDSPAILTSLVATVVDQWDDPDNTFTATEASASIAFTDGSDGGYTVANLEYKVGSAAWAAFDPADFTTPVVVEGLPVGATRSVRLRAVNAAGTGPQ